MDQKENKHKQTMDQRSNITGDSYSILLLHRGHTERGLCYAWPIRGGKVSLSYVSQFFGRNFRG